MVIFQVPYLLDRPGLGHHVQGEVYQVDDDMLALLDEIEDVPRYYKRKLESVRIIGDLMSPPEQSPSSISQTSCRTDAAAASIGKIVQCWCYKLDNFKEEMMLANPASFLISYSAKNYPYSES